MKNYQSPIGINKLNLLLFLTLSFPVFAAGVECKVNQDEDDIPEIRREESLDYKVVEAFIVKFLMKQVQNNALLPIDRSKNQVFSFPLIPETTFEKYLSQFRRLQLDPSCLLATYININKFIEKTGAKITRFNVHRLFLVALMVTHKHESEIKYLNSAFAGVGGVDIKILNSYEIKFWNTFNFRLSIKRDEYDFYISLVKEFESQLAEKK